MRIAVAGGTGVIGREAAAVVAKRGHEVDVLARSTGVDLATGAGLDGRLDGVDVVIDAAGIATLRAGTAQEFFSSVTRHLLQEEERAGVTHHVLLSVVGVDDVPLGYHRAKLAQERQVASGPVPWSLLRATQVHDFARQSLERGRVGSLVVVAEQLCQPVAASEVGFALAELAEGRPWGRAPDLAGPEAIGLSAMVRAAASIGRPRSPRRRVVGLRVPGAAGRALRGGALLPDDDRHPSRTGRHTFAQWVSNEHSSARGDW